MTLSKFRLTKTAKACFYALIFCQFCVASIVHAQTKPRKGALPAKSATRSPAPKITQVNAEQLKNILKVKGKPLLVNFWATWCDPCREEFPDLVKIDADYKNKIDFITVSLDELEELKTGVPQFLNVMKASMPAYLLTTPDEDALIASVSKDWQGGLPFTILYDADGKIVYTRMGKVKIDVLRGALEKLVQPPTAAEAGVK